MAAADRTHFSEVDAPLRAFAKSLAATPIGRWWARRTLSQRFTTITAILIAGGAILQGAVLIGIASHVVTKLAVERVEQRLDKAADQITLRVKEFRKVPQILSGTPPVPRIVDLSTGGTPKLGESLETWLERLGIIFRSIVQANPDLVQARFIGVADGGRELVRVNRIGKTIEIVPKDKLQRKGDRPYFKDIARQKAGEIYLSPIDANVENDRVVRPFQTVIRAGTPIFTEAGELFGIIVVNADAGSWLGEISGIAGLPGNFFAANQLKDYVYRTDGKPIFGSYDGQQQRFTGEFPNLARLFDSSGPVALNFDKADEFVTGRRINYDPKNPDEYIVIASETNPKVIFGDTWSLLLIGTLIAAAMALIGMFAAYLVSRPLKSLMSAAREIAARKLDVRELAQTGHGADVGELGQALRIMKDAVETRDASLRKSEAHLKAIIDNTIDGLITIDNKGIILRYNRGCEEIFGYTTNEALGRNVSMLMPKPDSDRHDSYLERYARTGEKRFIGVRREATGLHKKGHTVDLEVAVAEIKVGDEVLFSGIVRDITERKKIERIKSEFISMVTHELRTPLTSIVGSISLLRSGSLGPLPEKAQRMVGLAHDNGVHLTNLINDILDIDKIEGGHLTFRHVNSNLKTLIENAANLNAGCAKEHAATIVVDEIPPDIFIVTDPDRFQQIMGNLLSNAAKFSPPGGEVTVSAEARGPIVRISVCDQGPGIPEEFQTRIFSKFAQADSSDARQKGGTGLGLSIAKAIVERMGGRIGFETQAGKGATFYFDLIAHRESVAPPSGESPPTALKHSA
jgi:PAS domain S-box-containing protein